MLTIKFICVNLIKVLTSYTKLDRHFEPSFQLRLIKFETELNNYSYAVLIVLYHQDIGIPLILTALKIPLVEMLEAIIPVLRYQKSKEQRRQQCETAAIGLVPSSASVHPNPRKTPQFTE